MFVPRCYALAIWLFASLWLSTMVTPADAGPSDKRAETNEQMLKCLK